MENKLTVGIISDDSNIFTLQRAINICSTDTKTCEHVKNHLDMKILGSSLRSCMYIQGSYDIIILDMSSITLNNTEDIHYKLLKEFARKHSSSIIYIVSAVMANA